MALPDGLTNQEAESGDPTKYGGDPPSRCVPELKNPKSEPGDTTHTNRVKIKFDSVEQ